MWDELYRRTLKAVFPKGVPSEPSLALEVNDPPQEPGAAPSQRHTAQQSQAAKVLAAVKVGRRGNLGKARSILVGDGLATDPNTVHEMKSKFPAPTRPVVMPEQDPPVNLTEQDMEQLIKARSRTTLARLAQSAPACGAPDQFGFQTREHLAPMLHNPVLGQLTVDAILDPISRGYLPTMYSDIF